MNHELDYAKPIYNGTVGHSWCGKLIRLSEADESKPVDCPECKAIQVKEYKEER